MTLPLRHPSRLATQRNLSAVTVLNLLQKCAVHFCSEFNTITGASAPPLLPSSCCSFVNHAHPSSRSRPDCALPTGSTSPFALGLAPTPSQTAPLPTSTFRQSCPNYDCINRSTWSKSFPPLMLGRSSTSTSGPVAFTTSAVHHRAWIPTDTNSGPRQRLHSIAPARRPRTTGGLQTHCPTCISPEDNMHFDACKYVVAPNDLPSTTNVSPPSLPCLKLTTAMPTVRACDGDDNDGESTNHDDTQLQYSLSETKSC